MSSAAYTIDNLLPEYPVVPYDVQEEIKHLKEYLEDLAKTPLFSTAESICRLSRRLLYALEETGWLTRQSPPYQEQLQESIALLGQVPAHLNAVLAASQPEERELVSRFFDNITQRREELLRREDLLRRAVAVASSKA